MQNRLRTAILGATGMVGQRFVALLADHPWFQVVSVAASPRSAGKPYGEAVAGRWKSGAPVPEPVRKLIVRSVEDDLSEVAPGADLAFCALDLDKEKTKQLEIAYAAAGVPVVSNNSAHRWTEDVPVLLPEINPDHVRLIDLQRRKRSWTTGLIAVKPNCSIQSYVPVLTAWAGFGVEQALVTMLQAISGAGKTFADWPEMVDNVIPHIGGEEIKSEREPLKVWGKLGADGIQLAPGPQISATCIRVPVTDGHMASVAVRFRNSPKREELIAAIKEYNNPILRHALPSAPKKFLSYFDADDRPQTKSERDFENGMGITVGRLREDPVLGWKFVALSHNTVRGAAGGAVLMAELLAKTGYIKSRH
jgi:aspartate-semialdehyde dehydrogenase